VDLVPFQCLNIADELLNDNCSDSRTNYRTNYKRKSFSRNFKDTFISCCKWPGATLITDEGHWILMQIRYVHLRIGPSFLSHHIYLWRWNLLGCVRKIKVIIFSCLALNPEAQRNQKLWTGQWFRWWFKLLCTMVPYTREQFVWFSSSPFPSNYGIHSYYCLQLIAVVTPM
jgi:hypothetical protein